MIFANPQAWHLIWMLPLIAVGLFLFYQHRRKIMSRFAQEHLINDLTQGFSLKLYRLKAIFLMAAFVFMATALSRPQWGYHIRPVKRHGLDIMVVIDVSKSMLTQDVKPSRLERTKLAIKDLVMKLNGSDHIGLIAFAGDAMVMCPFTYDYNGFLLSLDDLSVGSISRGGTNISQAIEESVKAYQGMTDSELLRVSGMRTDKAVILVTDGEEEEGNAVDAARKARAKGVRIFTVGVGTREGDLIQMTKADGQTEFLKDSDGNVVKSRLNENLLAQIAYITGGAYVHSGGAQFGLDYLYDRQLSKLKKHDAEGKMAKQYDERFQWPLTLAFIFLMAETTISMHRRFGATLINSLSAPGGRRALSKNIFLCSFLLVLLVPAIAFASVAGEVNKANDLYKLGQFDDSLKLYQEALDQDDKSPVIKYDLGTALYKKGNYAKALGFLEQAAQDKNVKIKPKAEYNLGNVLYKSGVQKANINVDEAIKSLQEALGHYGQSLAVDPKDQDALFNQDFVKKEIERLKKKKQEQRQRQNQQQQQNQKQQQENQQAQDQKKQSSQGANQQQSPSQKQSESQDQKQQNAQAQAEENQKELDRKQAEDLLDEYRENQEPKKLLNYMPKKINDRPVLKDW